ncbi:phage antirepressor YoqD-like protein [Providencia alcalifaciens]|nr:phage antirepressor YoqD-like protein [Providencia alcalifaciens]
MDHITTLVNISSQTMRSIDFLDKIINPARVEAGEKPVRPSDFHARVNDEIDEYLNYEKFVVGKTGHKTYYTDLNFEQMTLVGMRESKAVRRSVLGKIKQLKPNSIPQTLPEALRFAADMAEQNQIIEQQLAMAAPKVEFVDSYVCSTGLLGFREACKLLNVKENYFKDFLINNKIMYLLAGTLSAYSQHLECGRFDVKTGKNPINGHAYSQTKFTAKGIQWIAGLLAKEKLEAA